MTIALLIAAFGIGFFGSPHCLGMCGGIVAAFGLSMQGVSTSKKRILIALYHSGRMVSYMLLGVVAALIGGTLAPALQHSPLPRILLGASLVFVALLMLGMPMLRRIERLGVGLWQKLSPIRQKVFPLDSVPKALAAGVLWGFLPCGLVYGAELMVIGNATNAATMGERALMGALMMGAFGLGTTPMLLATQTVVGAMQRVIAKFSLRKWSGVVMLVSGLAVSSVAALHAGYSHGAHDHAGHSHHIDHMDDGVDGSTHFQHRDDGSNSSHNHIAPMVENSEQMHSEHAHH